MLGIALGSSEAAAEKLKAAQALLEAGHEGATAIWRTMGEKSRRVGQSIAAASLPALKGDA